MRSSCAVWAFVLVCTLLPWASLQPVGLDGGAAIEAPELSPFDADADANADVEPRDKREIGIKLAAGFGVKDFLLDLVFGKVNQVIDYKTRLVGQLDRTNRYKNYYLLNLGTPPKGLSGTGDASAKVSAGSSGSSGATGFASAGASGGLGGLGAITSLLGSLGGGR